VSARDPEIVGVALHTAADRFDLANWRGCGVTAESGATGGCGRASPGASTRSRWIWSGGRRDRWMGCPGQELFHRWAMECRAFECGDRASEAISGNNLDGATQRRARALGG
jgi:hypothetical protein